MSSKKGWHKLSSFRLVANREPIKNKSRNKLSTGLTPEGRGLNTKLGIKYKNKIGWYFKILESETLLIHVISIC